MWNTTLYDTTRLTLELRELVAQGVDIWDFEYPSFYEGKEKKEFEQKVIDHFYFRQIGQETVGRFLHSFRSRVKEIMPYYIKLYESVKLMDDVDNPFEAYNLTEELTKKGKETTTHDYGQTITHSIDETSKRSDTPQGAITNIDTYLSEATKNDGENVDTFGGEDTVTVDAEGSGYKLERYGNIGVQPLGVEINYYRSALINVDMMIIDELNDLFLKIY